MQLLRAIGRAQPATAVRSALRERSADMRADYRLGLEKIRTDAYVQSQQNAAKIHEQRLESLQMKNKADAIALAEGDKNIPIESLTETLMYPELREMVKKYATQQGALSEDGTYKKRDESRLIRAMLGGPFAEKMLQTRIDIARKQYEENKSMLDEALKGGDVKKAAKLKESSAQLQRNLSIAQAKSDNYQKRMEMSIKQREIQVKEKNARKVSGGSYETDKAKLVDDTRAFYSSQAKLLLDPESGLIRQGPKEDPTKYMKEYQTLQKKMKKDMNRIRRGELPSWYSEENQMSDDEISKILRENGYRATPEAISQFRKNNGL